MWVVGVVLGAVFGGGVVLGAVFGVGVVFGVVFGVGVVLGVADDAYMPNTLTWGKHSSRLKHAFCLRPR